MIRKNYFSSVHPCGRSGPKNIVSYAQVIYLRKAGHSYDGISHLLSIHRATVASICQKHGLGGRRNLVNKKAIINLRILEKLSYGAIARKLLIPIPTVKAICQRCFQGGKMSKNQYS